MAARNPSDDGMANLAKTAANPAGKSLSSESKSTSNTRSPSTDLVSARVRLSAAQLMAASSPIESVGHGGNEIPKRPAKREARSAAKPLRSTIALAPASNVAR